MEYWHSGNILPFAINSNYSMPDLFYCISNWILKYQDLQQTIFESMMTAGKMKKVIFTCRTDILIWIYILTLFPNKPLFLHVCCFLVMSNFSFSHRVFYPFHALLIIFLKFKIVVCKLLEFERVWNMSIKRLKYFSNYSETCVRDHLY